MAEDDEARMAPAGAAASSFWNRSILTSTRSGPLSITSSVPCTASSIDAALLTRFAAASGSLARPWRATSCSDCAISAGAAASALGSGSQMRTSQPLRENTLAQARPISPTPTSPTVGMPLLRCSLDPLSLACRPSGPVSQYHSPSLARASISSSLQTFSSTGRSLLTRCHSTSWATRS